MNHAFENGHPKYADIHPRRPMCDVIKVVLQPFSKGSITSPTVDLRPTCDPCLDSMPGHIIWNGFSKFIDEYGPLWSWTNQAHIPLKNIE